MSSSSSSAKKKINFSDLYVFDLASKFSLIPFTRTNGSNNSSITNNNNETIIIPSSNLLTEDNLKKNTQLENKKESESSSSSDITSKKEGNVEEQGRNCHYCGVIPIDKADPNYIRNHYKQDYHRYNIKRNFHHQPPLSEDEFDKLVGELDESISGSESGSNNSSEENEDDDDVGSKSSTSDVMSNKIENLMRKTSLLDAIPEDDNNDDRNSNRPQHNSPFFLYDSQQQQQQQNGSISNDKVFAVYKAILNPKYLAPPSDDASEKEKQDIPETEELRMAEAIRQLDGSGMSAIFMIGGGHFSGAIISHERLNQQGNSNNNNSNPYADIRMLAHKSFHRYTTRRKQGGSQSASDNAHGKANSAGSSLRRYNEAALEKEIRELLQEWKNPYLSKVSSIYVRANGRTNRAVLMNYPNSPIVSSDPRLRSVPFTTGRATATEVKRVWNELTHAKIVDKPRVRPNTTESNENTNKARQQEKSSGSAKKKERDAMETHTQELTGLIRRSKVPGFVSYIKKHKLSPSELRLAPSDLPEFKASPTLLHYAASRGEPTMVTVLLRTLKADPTIQNAFGKTAYQVSANRATSDAFRVARGLMEDNTKWDWDNDARVESSLTKEEAREREAQDDLEKQAQSEANRNILLEAQQKEVRKAKRQAENKRAAAEAAAVLAASTGLVGGSRVLGNGSSSSNGGITGTSGSNSSSNGNVLGGNGNLSSVNATLLELTPEERRKFEREQRARAIEARLGLNKK